ncbi:MAG: HpcH/HpaI aldolase/citrate lyase family protein [Halobacteriales archaeon]
MDQRNRFRETIADDGVVLGARSATFSPTVIEVYGQLGLDFVWLDFEHTGPSPYDSTRFEDLTRAAEAGGTELLVRLPSGDPPLVRKVLDAGVRNLLIPRVDTAAEVREAVEATRFVYDGAPGERGKASGRSSGWGHATDYVETEDESVCLGVMIEKRTAVEALDDILAVPDLGFVFIGPSDLSVQLGHPTDKTHPEVREQVEAIVETVRASDVPLGGISHDPAGAVDLIERGYQIVRIGGDLEAARTTLAGRLEAVESEL